MAHEANNESQQTEKKSVVSFRSSFWFVIILVGLFIAALNFISMESKSNGEGKEKVAGTATANTSDSATPADATASQPMTSADDSASKAQTTTTDTTQSKK